MSGLPWLDLPALTLSLFNSFVLFWLGLTILLESDRRSFGIWLAADGLFLGGAFFLAHSAILENGMRLTFTGINFWWQAGWWPVILSPFAWYSVILWYAGFWDDPTSKLHIRQAPWFGLILASTAGLLSWMLLANPLPDIGVRGVPSSGFSFLAVLFPVYIILCILLALDAILRPGPTARMLGDEARRRARPWLTASTLVLLVVSLLVALALFWGVSTLESEYSQGSISPDTYYSLTFFDLIIEILITTAILLIGQAAMTYEVFTTHLLPRSGLRKRWFLAILTGQLISVTVSVTWVYTIRTELAVLAILPLLAAAITIHNKNAAREQSLESGQMRALIHSDQTYEKIFLEHDPEETSSDFQTSFTAICTQILQPAKAVLVPTGVLSNFLPGEISFPPGVKPPGGYDVRGETGDTPSGMMPQSLQPSDNDGFLWAVPLQSSRGLEGWVFIGKRENSSFYTMEEINLMRAACERLMDNQTAAEVARRLVILQRKQQIETRLLDQKARQVLHDEILPLLHTALLNDPKSPGVEQITLAHRQIAQLLREAPPPPSTNIAKNGLIETLRNTAQDEAKLINANLITNIDPGATAAWAEISPQAAETVFYAVRECLRNIQRHTRELNGLPIEICLSIKLDGALRIIVENNGSKQEPLEASTSGQGLLIHNALLAVFGGGLRLEHLENGIVQVTISLPLQKKIITH